MITVTTFLYSALKVFRKKLSDRVAGLLSVIVDVNGGLPQCVCRNCKRRLESLETAFKDLEAFRKQAREAYAAFLASIGVALERESNRSIELRLL